jgi:hypothetical protein
MSNSPGEIRQNSSPPRVVAISGIVFSALYITSLVVSWEKSRTHQNQTRISP